MRLIKHHEMHGRVGGKYIVIWATAEEDGRFGAPWYWAVEGIKPDGFPPFSTPKEAEQAARAYYRGRR